MDRDINRHKSIGREGPIRGCPFNGLTWLSVLQIMYKEK